jgi:uncharacterized membrane protein YciS (DUF1049 family)
VIFLIVAFIFCLPLVLFALSNTQMVMLGIWPFDYTVQVHLSLAILAAMAVSFFIGGVFVWFSVLRQRRRASRAEHKIKLLEAQIDELKGRPAIALPPAS